MAKLCPFKKIETTTIEYNCSDYANARGKPKEIVKKEEFSECSCLCMAYDSGICKMMEGKR